MSACSCCCLTAAAVWVPVSCAAKPPAQLVVLVLPVGRCKSKTAEVVRSPAAFLASLASVLATPVAAAASVVASPKRRGRRLANLNGRPRRAWPNSNLRGGGGGRRDGKTEILLF